MALIKKLRKDKEVRESREADLVSYNDVRWRAIQTCLRHLTTSSLRRLSFYALRTGGPRDVGIGISSEDWAEEEAEEVGGQRQQVEER